VRQSRCGARVGAARTSLAAGGTAPGSGVDRCHDLAVHHDIKTGVVVLEYASEGRVVPTGAPYTNRYISVLTITDRKVTHWRDYLDPVAVFDALGWPSR
jgi:ketosteroid isomerase-like protein